MSNQFTQAFGYETYFVPLLASSVHIANVRGHGIGANGFIDITTLLGGNLPVVEADVATSYGIGAGTGVVRAIANVVRTAGGVVTLTIPTSSHAIGDIVEVAAVTNTSINGFHRVTAATTTTISYIQPGTAAIETGSDTGNATVYPGLKLDGTDDPIKLMGLKTCSLSTDQATEEIITYDTDSNGFSQKVATSKSAMFDLAGVANFRDVGYKLLRLCDKNSVSQSLMGKMVRRGPIGSTETVFAYGRFGGFSEANDAGSVAEWTATFEIYGPYAMNFSV